MLDLQTLRRKRVVSLAVLLALGLAHLAAVATPWFAAGRLQWVCSATGGAHWVQIDISDGTVQGDGPARGLDCPLCLPLGTPALASQVLALALLAMPQSEPWLQTAPRPAPAAPWQARAPPAHSFFEL